MIQGKREDLEEAWALITSEQEALTLVPPEITQI